MRMDGTHAAVGKEPVILSAAKELDGGALRHETLCCDQDDGAPFSFFLLHFLICILIATFSLAFSRPSLAADARKVVIPFDFVSKFDDGRYGQMMGDMIWKKLSRENGFVVPDSMNDVRDYCESHKLRPSPAMDLDKIKKIVEDGFGGQIGIWGSVERAPGAEGEIYDLAIKCVDFSAKPKPKVIYEIKTRTNSVSEIPHVYVKQMLDAMSGRDGKGDGKGDSPHLCEAPSGPSRQMGTVPFSALAENNWKNNKNLVAADFEHGAGGVPKGWDKVAGQQRESLGGLVRWTAEKGNAYNKVIRFTLDRNVAENEGVMYYSDFFPVEEGAKHRFQCRWRTDGPAVKVFLKCYAADETGRRREVYRRQLNVQGPSRTWNTETADFTPKAPKYSPKWGRVMLYAYLHPGEVEFDDVVVKQIVPASPGESAKVRRPSSQSKITVRQMQEDERRSRQSGSHE